MTARDELDVLLNQDPARVQAQAISLWPRLAANRPVVLHGAGGLGIRLLSAMRADGADAVAFSDNGLARQGTTIEGLSVLSPADAVRRHPDAIFVITIWGANSTHRQAHSREQLTRLGAAEVCSFPVLAWHHHRWALPHYLVDLPDGPLHEADRVRAAFETFADETSRQEFVDQVRLRVTGSYDHLRPPVKHRQYYPDDVIAWRAGEVIVDGGAYDGDSLRSWIEWRSADFARWIAVEPDPANLARFRATVAAQSPDLAQRMVTHEVALGTKRGELTFSATGTAGATTAQDHARGAPTVTVQVAPLDELVQDEQVSLIKLDIEGGELEALDGSVHTVRRCRPVLAICAYHRQDHLWEVPLRCRELLPDSRLILRPHNEEGWDLVCYAVPAERWRGGSV